MNWISEEVNCYLNNWVWELIWPLMLRWFFFSLSLLLFSDPLFLGGLSHYIVSFYTILIVHLFIIQAPTWVYVPSAIFFGSPWMVVVEIALFRGLLHINTASEVATVNLMRWWQPLLLDISVFLSSLHVPEVHPYRWILLEGHLDCLNICWSIFFVFEEYKLLGLYPFIFSLRDSTLWASPNHLLLLGRIPVLK